MAAQQAKAAEKADSKFDPSAIEKMLHSKEKPSQSGSTGKEISRTASLGAPKATGQKLNPSQKDALGSLLKEQLAQCWSPPAGLANADNLKPRIRMSLKEDGSLSAEPTLTNSSGDPAFRSMAESALRAVRKCAPFRIPAQYAPFYGDWSDWNITFDAKEMLS
jgi:colicin import membrane protein